MPPDPVELPVACSLQAVEGAERVARWRVLHDRAIPEVQREPGRLVIRYPRLAGVSQELEALVSAERTCCAFADWRLKPEGDTVVLEIRASDEGLEALAVALLDR